MGQLTASCWLPGMGTSRIVISGPCDACAAATGRSCSARRPLPQPAERAKGVPTARGPGAALCGDPMESENGMMGLGTGATGTWWHGWWLEAGAVLQPVPDADTASDCIVGRWGRQGVGCFWEADRPPAKDLEFFSPRGGQGQQYRRTGM